MKLFDFGESDSRSFIRQILEWSQRRVSLFDNLDCDIVGPVRIETTETQVGHNLGRVPRGVIEMASGNSPQASGTQWNGTVGIAQTKQATVTSLYLKRKEAGETTLVIF